MFFARILNLAVAIGVVLAASGDSAGQYISDQKPLSRVGGPTEETMNQIVRQSVGQGYNVQSLNLIALQNSRSGVPYVGQQSTRGTASGPRLPFGSGGSSTAKPFTSFSPEPTVSPYLNLFREDFEGNSDLNYNTLVRPMLQQQAVNQQVQRQAQDLQRQLQSVAAQSDFNPQGAKDVYPTGHQTVFRYYGHYYPTMGRQRRR
jgi:hypothetical protein